MDDTERFETVCALVDASIGYFTPRQAALVVEAYERGETEDACERCLACFGGDLRKMVDADRRTWSRLPENRKDGVREYVSQVTELDGPRQETLGLMYPTLSL